MKRSLKWPLYLTGIMILTSSVLLFAMASFSNRNHLKNLRENLRNSSRNLERSLLIEEEALSRLIAHAALGPTSTFIARLQNDLRKAKPSFSLYSKLTLVDDTGKVLMHLVKVPSGTIEAIHHPIIDPFEKKLFTEPSYQSEYISPGVQNTESGGTLYYVAPVNIGNHIFGKLIATYDISDLLKFMATPELRHRYYVEIKDDKGIQQASTAKLRNTVDHAKDSVLMNIPGTNLKLYFSKYERAWNARDILLYVLAALLIAWIVGTTIYQNLIIHRMQKTTEKLKISEEKLTTIFENTPDIIVTIDRRGIIKYLNRSDPHNTVEKSLGTNVLDYLDEPQKIKLKSVIDKVVETRENLEYEISTNADLSYSVRAVPLLKNGFVDEIMLISTPTTQIKIAEKQLRLTQYGVDHSIVGAFLVNPDGFFEYVNEASAQMLGYPVDELKGLNVINVGTEVNTPEKWQQVWQRIKNDSRKERVESFLRRKDASTVPVVISANYIDFDGCEYLWAFARDITQEMKIAEEVSLAKESAEAANRSKSEFLANMSHEIRTPMSAILGFAQLLQRNSVSDERHSAYISAIERNGQHLLALINDILDISKVESGHLTIERRQCSPRSIIEDVIHFLAPSADAKGIALDVSFAPTLPKFVILDPNRFRQILINIIGNAIKFTGRNGKVSIDAAYNEAHLEIIISDTGIGIDPNQIPRLFSPFSQANTSVSRDFGGTGLGLVLSRRFARAMNGDVKIIESHPGKGSKFHISVGAGEATMFDPVFEAPKEIIPRDKIRKEPSAPSNASDFDRSLGGLNVLLVEDGPDNQLLISHVLRSAGAKVDTAENGMDGVEKALCRNYDLVLMDIQMPELDGYQATAMLRNAQYTGPIVALTAHAMVGEKERCLAAGCNDYLTKPVDFDLLLSSSAKWAHAASKADHPYAH